MKKTGKVLSMVLSLALVASSLTATTFASAASSETAKITLTSDSIALANGGKDATLISPDLKTKLVGIKSAELADHSDVMSALDLKDVAITSGSDKVKLEKPDSDKDGEIDSVKLTLKNADVSGTVTLLARYEGKVQRGNDDDANTRVYGTAAFTVTIYDHSKVYIAGKATELGDDPADLDTLARNSAVDRVDNTVTGVIETVAPDTDATATWSAVTGTVALEKPADETEEASADKKAYVVSVSGAVTPTATTVGFTLANKADKGTLASAGKISVRVDEYTVAKGEKVYKATNHVTAKTAIDNKYIAGKTADTIISKYSSKTYIGNAPADKTTSKTSALTDITGSDVVLPDTADVTMNSGKIGNVTVALDSEAAKFKVEDGSVGNIDTNGDVTVNGGSVGNVTIADTKTLDINGGTVKDIDGDGTVAMEPADDESPIKVGKISAKVVTANSADKASVITSDITMADGGSVTLTGDAVKVGNIDGDYRAASLTLDAFKGSIVAPTHTYTEGINDTAKSLALSISGEDANATVTGAASFNGISMSDGAILTFADKISLGDEGATGDGTLEFAPNALYTKGDITTSVRLTKDFKAGDVVFTAATDAVDESDFTPVGFSVEKVAATTAKDAFKVKDTSFASLEIQGSAKIPLNTTESYTAVAYPTGTKLPEGYKVSWTFSGNSDYLEAVADANDSSKITVKALKEDKTFSSLNKGTLTAMVVDEDGFENYDYPEATFDVSIGAKPVTYVSDTTGTMNMTVGQTYQFKITSSDGTVPPFVVASNGATVAPYTKSGNAYLYKVTAAKAGDFGVYVGNRVCVLHITSGVTCDTAKVSIANGKTYQFKVTAPKLPTFVVAGIGAVKPASVNGNNYFYKVTNNGKTGTVGVYVNGVHSALITFTK